MADDFAGIDSVANVSSKETYLRDLRNGVLSAAPVSSTKLPVENLVSWV